MLYDFFKEHDQILNDLNLSKGETKEDLEMSKLLREFQEIFIDDILGEMPPSQGMDDHNIDII